MTVTITEIYGGGVKTYTGEPDEVDAQLRVDYDWLSQYGGADLKADLARLGNTESLIVRVEV